MSQQLLIVGASSRAAACSAKHAGFEPFGIDLFADEDLQALGPSLRIPDFRRGLPAAWPKMPEAAWVYTGGLENHPGLVDRLAADRPLLGNAGDVLRQVRDPWQLERLLRREGFLYPEIGRNPHLLTSTGPLLLKPRRSAGGRNIQWLPPNTLSAVERGYYVQRYVAGETCSAAYVAAAGDARLLGTTRQLITHEWISDISAVTVSSAVDASPQSISLTCASSCYGEPFGYIGSIAPLPAGEAVQDELLRLGKVLAADFGLLGLFGVDFIRNSEGIWPLEINPRYTASMEVLEQVHSISMIGLHVDACSTGRLPNAISNKGEAGRYSGKTIVYADHDAVVSETLTELAQSWNGESSWPRMADIPSVGTPVRCGEPLVTVSATANNVQELAERLRQRSQQVLACLT